jgi:Methyltransferase domain
MLNATESLHVLIALHACDTATDDAIWSGIARNAHVIVVAPCCHQECRPQLNVHASKNSDHPLYDVLRHNIYRERLTETATDSMRALLLEIAGYQVQVFEFVGGEHTSKNVMITAVRSYQNADSSGKHVSRNINTDTLRKRLISLATLHGIREQKLATWMSVSLVPEENETHPLLSA